MEEDFAICALFTYGTLAPGRPNAHIFEPLAGTWSEGYVLGTLYKEGWGSELGYPGIRLDGNDVVEGHIFESVELDQLWPKLDEFEGAGYCRKEVEVILASGESISAYIYAIG